MRSRGASGHVVARQVCNLTYFGGPGVRRAHDDGVGVGLDDDEAPVAARSGSDGVGGEEAPLKAGVEKL